MVWPTGTRPKGDGVIQIRWGSNPRRHEVLKLPHTDAGKREAARIRAKRIQEERFGKPNAPAMPMDSPRFAEAAQRWLTVTGKKKRWSDGYYNEAKNALNLHWMPFFGDQFMSDITFEMLDQAWEAKEFASAKTAQNVLSPAKGVWSYAFQKNWIVEDIAQRIHVTSDQKPEIEPFSLLEREAIIGALDTMAAASKDPFALVAAIYWVTAFDTGMRSTSEICALTWRDYDRKRFRVAAAIVRGKNANRTKTKQPRNVFVTKRVKERLETLPSRWTDKAGYIFTLTNFVTTNQIKDGEKLNDIFYQACDLAGVSRRRPYNCRHTFATLALRAGMKPVRVARHLGHTVETLYRRYAGWIDSDDDQADILDMERHYQESAISKSRR